MAKVTRADFVEAWEWQVKQIDRLGFSLPTEEISALLDLKSEYRRLIEAAAKHSEKDFAEQEAEA